ncbi:hypothetical protein DSM21852_22570 [Methylocystis bryophila]|nr:hypothetical protein DSM21852_22570 [Methylocystis bryophila]
MRGCFRDCFGRYDVWIFTPLLQRVCAVPSLVRFLTILAVLGAIAYGIMLALVSFVTPEPREMTQTISPTKLNK